MTENFKNSTLPAARHLAFAAGVIAIFAVALFAASSLFAQVEDASPPAAEMPADRLDDLGEAALESVEVDWWEQIRAGGLTMVALGLVSVAGIAFTVERLFMVRQKYYCPRGLADSAVDRIEAGDLRDLLKLARNHPSTLGRIITFLVEHRENDYGKLTSMAESLGARDIIDQEERTYPLAVIAAVAPLLGLLGTMIGMIEAFQLVSVYGDEGGASMLAGSIAKALITTATGLILAIPAIAAFHYFKHKMHKLGVQLDKDVEQIITSRFFVKSDLPEAEESPDSGATIVDPSK